MSLDPAITRRTLLAAGAGGLSVAALAACSSSGTKTSDAGQPAAASATSDSTSAAAGTAASSAESSATSAGSASSSAAGGNTLTSLDSIAVGAAKSVKLPSGKPAIVSRTTSTQAVCFSAICTHEGCTVAPAKTSLDCPCHGSKFDLKTGKVLAGPAPSALPKIAVQVEGGNVVTT